MCVLFPQTRVSSRTHHRFRESECQRGFFQCRGWSISCCCLPSAMLSHQTKSASLFVKTCGVKVTDGEAMTSTMNCKSPSTNVVTVDNAVCSGMRLSCGRIERLYGGSMSRGRLALGCSRQHRPPPKTTYYSHGLRHTRCKCFYYFKCSYSS